jgi:hypothetical protein
VTYNPPPPNQPPQGPLGMQYSNAIAPTGTNASRQAAGVLVVLACLAVGCGAYQGYRAFTIPLDQIVAQMGSAMPQAPPGVSLERLMHLAFGVAVAFILGFALLLFLLAKFVRDGRRGAMMTALIICFPLGFLEGLNTLGGAITLAMKPSGDIAFQTVYSFFVLAACVMSIITLLRARHTPSQFSNAALHSQYLQLQQQGVQSPTGYGYAPPPGWQQQLQTPMPPQQAIGPLPPPPGDQPQDAPPSAGA